MQRRKRAEGVIRMWVGGVWEWGSDQLMEAVNNNYIAEPTFVLGFWKTCKWVIRVLVAGGLGTEE